MAFNHLRARAQSDTFATGQLIHFSINCSDDLSGVQEVRLYVDNILMDVQTAGGRLTVESGPFIEGVHLYLVEAVDYAGTQGQDPQIGVQRFTIKGFDWYLLAIGLMLSTALLSAFFYVLRQR